MCIVKRSTAAALYQLVWANPDRPFAYVNATAIFFRAGGSLRRRPSRNNRGVRCRCSGSDPDQRADQADDAGADHHRFDFFQRSL